MNKHKILVTGGAGFIGSHIVEKLVRENYFVRVLDNFSTGNQNNLNPDTRDNIDIIEGDIRSYHIVQNAMKDIDVILHLAALPSVPRSIKDPITTNEVNVVGTLNILNAAREYGVKRLVFSSSSSIYGNNPVTPKTENMCPNPLSPYAISKMTAENYCRVFAEIYGLQTISLRYFNVFGPKQNPFSEYSAVIPKFINLILNNKQITIDGDGNQSRDFTYVDNVVDANLRCIMQEIQEKYLVMNIACQESISLNRFVSILSEKINKKINVEYIKSRSGDVKHSLADIGSAKHNIGYKPLITFENGIEKTISFYKDK
ncbi:MAG: SDR family oxidoreductase [Ignavibacteriae bacterium]|nr:SDR family oxidoreductase [Ignavibacteriota bacterium]